MIKIYKYFVYIILFCLTTQVKAQSLQDLQKLKTEYEKYQKGQLQPNNSIPNMDREQIQPGLPKTATIVPYNDNDNENVDKKEKARHYGYDFFTKRDTVSFWENLPTPSNYYLAPGDELIISVWGQTQLRKTYKISRDGKIYDEKVGLLNLLGKNINGAEKYLRNQYGRVYSTLNGNNPTSFIDISLGDISSINVNFVGEVKFPGVYPIHPFSNVITGLIQAGGIDTTGSLRNIIIKRNNGPDVSIDLYNYLIKGSIPKNIQLRDQDIVLVPVRISTIHIDSSVVRPKIYEAKKGESVKELISFAGGLTSTSSNTVGLRRLIVNDEDNSKVTHTKNYYIDYQNSNLTEVQNGDRITVRKIFESINQVEIIGQIKIPGKYYYYEGMKLNDLIKLGGGFNDSTFLKSIYQKRGEIVRRNPETRYESVIEVDLNKIINGDLSSNIELQNLDRFVVHANLNFFEKENVQILGEVNIPGSYPLISDNETLRSLLQRAGNLTSKALKDGISIYRNKKYFEITEIQEKAVSAATTNYIQSDNLQRNQSTGSSAEDRDQSSNKPLKNDASKVRVAWNNEGIILMPGDSIIIKEKTMTINVSGQVYNPGLIEFINGKSLRYYVSAAGGVSKRGDKKSIIVIYANGFVSPNKWYNTPKIEDGATIIVNQKEAEFPFDITQFATNWTSIISSMITAVVLANQL